jgi:hypothetical protein
MHDGFDGFGAAHAGISVKGGFEGARLGAGGGDLGLRLGPAAKAAESGVEGGAALGGVDDRAGEEGVAAGFDVSGAGEGEKGGQMLPAQPLLGEV